MKKRKPIVLLQLTGPGQRFTFEDAFALLSDLEGKMPARNPYCLNELRNHLGDTPLAEFQQIACAALEQGRAMAARMPHLNINGTSNQLEASLVDLVEALAASTRRTCKWQGGSRWTHTVEHRSSSKRTHRSSSHLLSQRRLLHMVGVRSSTKMVQCSQQLLSNGRRRRRSSAVKLQGALRRQIAHPKTHRQGVPPVSAGTESCSSDTMGV
jgi:hypothetical protein